MIRRLLTGGMNFVARLPARIRLRRGFGLALLLFVQAVCVFCLFGDMLSETLPFQLPLSFTQSDSFENVQNAVLLFSLLFTSWELLHLVRRNRHVESELRAASGAFHALLMARFEEWTLTASERDVAALAIKGLGIAEIARLRQTREGTVKAQLNAIYRKAGVNGRPQFISLFIEELMGVPLSEPQNEVRPADGLSGPKGS